MNRQQAKELLPIIQAFAEGKTIEVRYKSKYNPGERIETTIPSFYDSHEYRIKPEPNYRPFANAEECWQEMLKHQPFGWIRNKITKNRYEIECLKGNLISSYDDICCSDLEEFFQKYDFADGTPFGIKEE